MDFKSTNGTFFADTSNSLISKRFYQLNHGMKIRFGPLHAYFEELEFLAKEAAATQINVDNDDEFPPVDELFYQECADRATCLENRDGREGHALQNLDNADSVYLSPELIEPDSPDFPSFPYERKSDDNFVPNETSSHPQHPSNGEIDAPAVNASPPPPESSATPRLKKRKSTLSSPSLPSGIFAPKSRSLHLAEPEVTIDDAFESGSEFLDTVSFGILQSAPKRSHTPKVILNRAAEVTVAVTRPLSTTTPNSSPPRHPRSPTPKRTQLSRKRSNEVIPLRFVTLLQRLSFSPATSSILPISQPIKKYPFCLWDCQRKKTRQS